RDKDLVRVLTIKLKLSNGNTVLVPAVVPVTMATLLRALGRSAQWRKFNHKREKVSIDPPSTIAEQILGMADEWPFPPLRGIRGGLGRSHYIPSAPIGTARLRRAGLRNFCASTDSQLRLREK